MDTFLNDKKCAENRHKEIFIPQIYRPKCDTAVHIYKQQEENGDKLQKGWERYKKISADYAQEIRDAVDNIQDINELTVKIHIIKLEIQVESFWITWEGTLNCDS